MLSCKGLVRADFGNNEGKSILRARYGCKGPSTKKIFWFHPIL